MHRLDELLDGIGCTALVIVARSSRDCYLAPFLAGARLGASFLIAPRGRPPRLGFLTPMEREEAAAAGLALLTPEDLDVVRWTRDAATPARLLADILSRGLHLCELAPGRIALAGCESAGKVQTACELLRREGWSFAAGEPLVATLRRSKTRRQVAAIRSAAAGAAAALVRVAEILRAAAPRSGELWLGDERLRVRDLRQAIAEVLAEHRLEQPEGNIVAPAEEGAVPHTSGTDDRVLRLHESLVVDLFPQGELFADCTRTFCVGEPPRLLARAHAQVEAALELARGRARAGVRGWQLQEIVCERLAAAGYPTPISDHGTPRGYVHGLGHGVGWELHEYPSFKEEAGDEGHLEEGDVITLEPGLYDPGAGYGVRLEDLYRVGSDGLEPLVELPTALDPRAW